MLAYYGQYYSNDKQVLGDEIKYLILPACSILDNPLALVKQLPN
jgi:hypothetical protein